MEYFRVQTNKLYFLIYSIQNYHYKNQDHVKMFTAASLNNSHQTSNRNSIFPITVAVLFNKKFLALGLKS